MHLFCFCLMVSQVHIEQGPVLETLGLPLGLVKGIAGQTRLKVLDICFFFKIICSIFLIELVCSVTSSLSF